VQYYSGLDFIHNSQHRVNTSRDTLRTDDFSQICLTFYTPKSCWILLCVLWYTLQFFQVLWLSQKRPHGWTQVNLQLISLYNPYGRAKRINWGMVIPECNYWSLSYVKGIGEWEHSSGTWHCLIWKCFWHKWESMGNSNSDRVGKRREELSVLCGNSMGGSLTCTSGRESMLFS
jgi:hypothetical protein